LATPISIFNDVLGPIMRGPSSSHTAGAYRIARIARDLLGDDIAAVRCVFDPEGSYAATYKPLGVDKALCAGLLGWQLTDERYERAVATAVGSGLRVAFAVEPLPWAEHPNDLLLELEPREGAILAVRANSPGGGSICIHTVDDQPVDLDGRGWEVLVWAEADDTGPVRDVIRRVLMDGTETAMSESGGRTFLRWRSLRAPDRTVVERIKRMHPGARIRSARPVFYPPVGTPLVASGSEAVRAAEERRIRLSGLAQSHEASLLGMPEAGVRDEVLRRYGVMRTSILEGLDASRSAMSWLEPTADRILTAESEGALPLGGPQTRAAARALAVMHVCNSHGIVCAAPTGGSAGVLPGVLSVLEEELGLEEVAIVNALLVAGLIGVVFASRATFAAEIAGCQVEIGAAGAMAAAAVVEAAGGTARQACDAASIALQNTMGSVCDPVGGGCEIPCHTRNAVAAASAFTIADLVMGGYVNPIPLDETIDASLAVGASLPAELRCTARGGIAVTPSALKLIADAEDEQAGD